MKATAKDLRFHSKELLDTVSRGEEVIITFRGKPVAKLIPYNSDSADKSSDTQLYGMWKDNEVVEDVYGYIRDIRKGRF
jgi:prevent-host-death family protein